MTLHPLNPVCVMYVHVIFCLSMNINLSLPWNKKIPQYCALSFHQQIASLSNIIIILYNLILKTTCTIHVCVVRHYRKFKIVIFFKQCDTLWIMCDQKFKSRLRIIYMWIQTAFFFHFRLNLYQQLLDSRMEEKSINSLDCKRMMRLILL